MNLISLNDVCLRYGSLPLLANADLHVAQGDSLAIIGRNGCGKTTLMKIIAGLIEPDSGLVEKSRTLKTAYLQQEVPVDLQGNVYSVVASGLGEIGESLARYHELLSKIEVDHSEVDQHEFDALLHDLNECGAFRYEPKIAEIIDKLELTANANVANLSAGLKRRTLLGKGLVADPDILLLDEPTNHLDLNSVVWLENFLKVCGKTLVFVSHDRSFLEKLSNRVVEVDRGRIVAFDCSFKKFLERREELLSAEEKQNAVFDKKLAQEEAWLRQGVKARRTRNEGRVRSLLKFREVRALRRNRQGQAGMQIQTSDSGGQKVIELQNICMSYSGRQLIRDFGTTIFKGDKIGIIGANGTGKTTLLKILLGQITPDSGEVKLGTNLEILYFDQLRQELNPKMRLCDFVANGADFVEINGQKQNIIGYLQNFLFEPEQIRGEIGMLSGGERNRLLLAKLFTRPANLLVLDEPTNDLDIETLELLEAKLVDFQGTVLLVSHDRSFLNNIVTGIFGFEGDGTVAELVGGYDEWETHLRRKESANASATPKQEKPKYKPQKREVFTQKERRELEEIPLRIDVLEAEQAELADKLQDADFLRNNAEKIKEIQDRLAEIQAEDETLFERWNFLEERKKALE